MNLKILLVALVSFSIFCAQAALITSLPGLNPMPPWKQYSGYININSGSSQKSLFYWFVESQNNPQTDPVVLWLQGGPGCSGLIGLFLENGPFSVSMDGITLINNPYSWNKNASIIYLEQPAGVGFSSGNSSEAYRTNDNQTALDNYNFLQGWFDEFPEYSDNDFWITGESYGGIYVPTLTYQILTGSDQNLKNQLKGFAIGNPVIRCSGYAQQFYTNSVELFYWHGMISLNTREEWFNNNCDTKLEDPKCVDLYLHMRNTVSPLDKDNLYQNFCIDNGTLNFVQEIPKCFGIDDRTIFYLNQNAVQQAIHANSPISGTWNECSFPPTLDYLPYFDMNMIDFYNYFFANAKLRILIYSGDVDIATVPHAMTQECLSQLNRPIVNEWSRWTVPGPKLPESTPNKEAKEQITAGYQEIYDTYSFATVRGAGHEVPQFQPLFAYNIFQRFIISGENL